MVLFVIVGNQQILGGRDFPYGRRLTAGIFDALLLGAFVILFKALAKGADINIKNDAGQTPLDILKDLPRESPRRKAYLAQFYCEALLDGQKPDSEDVDKSEVHWYLNWVAMTKPEKVLVLLTAALEDAAKPAPRLSLAKLICKPRSFSSCDPTKGTWKLLIQLRDSLLANMSPIDRMMNDFRFLMRKENAALTPTEARVKYNELISCLANKQHAFYPEIISLLDRSYVVKFSTNDNQTTSKASITFKKSNISDRSSNTNRLQLNLAVVDQPSYTDFSFLKEEYNRLRKLYLTSCDDEEKVADNSSNHVCMPVEKSVSSTAVMQNALPELPEVKTEVQVNEPSLSKLSNRVINPNFEASLTYFKKLEQAQLPKVSSTSTFAPSSNP